MNVNYVITDPIYHGAADVLPDDHPDAWSSIYCVRCSTMVHAFNNECMTGWFETAYGPMCFECFDAMPYRDDVPGPGSTLYVPDLETWISNAEIVSHGVPRQTPW